MKKSSLLLLLIAVEAGAQTTGNWTHQIPQRFPSARSGHGMAYDAAHGQVILFGGDDPVQESDTWAWDGSNWNAKSPQAKPSARDSFGMAYDAARGQIVLFGGAGPPVNFAPGSLNDTWVWDGSNWTQKTPQTSPPARQHCAMVYDAARQKVVLFGGFSFDQDDHEHLLNDTWVWDGSNWTQERPQTSPAVRKDHAMAFDAAHGQVVLFGGDTSADDLLPNDLNDTWVWDGSNWTQKTSQSRIKQVPFCKFILPG